MVSQGVSSLSRVAFRKETQNGCHWRAIPLKSTTGLLGQCNCQAGKLKAPCCCHRLSRLAFQPCSHMDSLAALTLILRLWFCAPSFAFQVETIGKLIFPHFDILRKNETVWASITLRCLWKLCVLRRNPLETDSYFRILSFPGHRPGVAGGGWDDADDEPILMQEVSPVPSAESTPVNPQPSSSKTSSKSSKSATESDHMTR